MLSEWAMDTAGYRKLLAWQKADDLAIAIYRATSVFPRTELFGLTSQLRRAAVSIPSNIAEGTGRQNRKELKQFINIALGSQAEVEYLLSLGRRLGYLSDAEYQQLETNRSRVGALLWKLHQSL